LATRVGDRQALDQQPHAAGLRHAGFTLLELLVVMSILSVLATFAGLSIGLGGRSQDTDAGRFAEIFDRARYLAIAEGRVVALALSASEAQVMRRDGGAWVPYGAAIALDGTADLQGDRLIVVWPSDQSDPVQVDFRLNSGRSVRCTATGVGGVSCSG